MPWRMDLDPQGPRQPADSHRDDGPSITPSPLFVWKQPWQNTRDARQVRDEETEEVVVEAKLCLTPTTTHPQTRCEKAALQWN